MTAFETYRAEVQAILRRLGVRRVRFVDEPVAAALGYGLSLTEDRTVYLSRTRPSAGRIGLDHVDFFSSEEGIPLSTRHEYELVSTYDNTTSENQDSMAVMYLYLLDKEFKKPLL